MIDPELQSFMASLPEPMLRQMFMQCPFERAGSEIFIPVILWLAVILVYVIDRSTGTLDALLLRGKSTGVFILIFTMAFMFTQGVGRAIADKGGNPPAQTNSVEEATGSIRLFFTDKTGRLVPLGAAIRGDK